MAGLRRRQPGDARRYETYGLTTRIWPADVGQLEPLTPEQERQASELDDLENRLEELRQQDWPAYGEMLKANLESIARRKGLRVPVLINIDLDTLRSTRDVDSGWTSNVADQLLAEAINETPLPGDGRPPLERLFDGLSSVDAARG